MRRRERRERRDDKKEIEGREELDGIGRLTN